MSAPLIQHQELVPQNQEWAHPDGGRITITNQVVQHTPPAPTTEFFEALSQTALACHYIQKDARNTFHGYGYASASAVLEKIGEALQKYGLVSYVRTRLDRIMERQRTDKKTGQPTGVEYIAVAEAVLTIVKISDRSGITVSAYGAGQDVGDKAVMKAETAAIKYAWMLTLNVATGDDPEADTEVDKRNAGPEKAARATSKKTGVVYEETELSEVLRQAEAAAIRAGSCNCGLGMVADVKDRKPFLACQMLAEKIAAAKTPEESREAAQLTKIHRFEWYVRP